MDLSGDATNPLGVTGNDSRRDDPSWSPGLPNVGPLREIGRGGFGVVYLAFDSELDREVAIKVLTGVLDDPARARFARERRAIGRLSGHPNIVTVYQTGIAPDGRPYIVMEYLPGGSLGDRLRKGAMPWSEAVDVAIQLCSAVQAAHNEGVLHRDIKPQNVLIDRFGKSKLGDFGLAQLGDATGTQSGSVVATVAHAAPEILEGRPATPVSDVYSLASTVFAVIAGRPAFVNPSDESILPMYARIAEQPVPNLRPSGVPDAVCAAIEAGMHKDPDQRIRSPAELGRRLATVLAPNEAEQRLHELEPERRRQLSRFLRRRRPVVLVGMLILAIALGAVGLTLLRSGGSANTVSATVVLADPGGTDGIAATRGAIWVVNATDQLAQIDPNTNRVTSTIHLTGPGAAVSVGDGSVWVADFVDNEVLRVDPAAKRVANTIPVGRNPIAIAVSGKYVWVANGADGTVSRINTMTSSVIATIPISAPAAEGLTGLAIGEGSVWVANSSDGTLSRIDPATNRVATSTAIADPGTGGLQVTAGDGTIWATTRSQALQFDASGRVRTRINLPSNVVLAGTIGDHPLGVGFGALWLGTAKTGPVVGFRTNAPESVLRVDLATRRTTVVNTPRTQFVSGLVIDSDARAVWVAGFNIAPEASAFVMRINP